MRARTPRRRVAQPPDSSNPKLLAAPPAASLIGGDSNEKESGDHHERRADRRGRPRSDRRCTGRRRARFSTRSSSPLRSASRASTTCPWRSARSRAETIERQGITDLVDIGKFVPNLNVTGFSAGHTSSANPFIRGIGLQDHLITTDPGVGVYVDGIYLGRQVGQNWSLSNIERVEVLRGPQGTLYGRNSIGGAINIITRKPGDEDGGRVSLTAGSRGRLNGDVYTNMRLTEQFAMSLTAAYQRRDGLGNFLLIENPDEGSRRNAGHFRARRDDVGADGEPVLPGDRGWQRRRQRPAALRHADRRAAERRRVRGRLPKCRRSQRSVRQQHRSGGPDRGDEPGLRRFADGRLRDLGRSQRRSCSRATATRNTRAASTTTASSTTSSRSRKSAKPTSSRWNCSSRARAVRSITCSAVYLLRRGRAELPERHELQLRQRR